MRVLQKKIQRTPRCAFHSLPSMHKADQRVSEIPGDEEETV